MQLNNSILRLFFARLALGKTRDGTLAEMIQRREDGYARFAEQRLAASPYLAGPDLTCADIMALYCLRSPRMLGARDDLPNVRAYVERIGSRPAYAKAMALVGAQATPPGDAAGQTA